MLIMPQVRELQRADIRPIHGDGNTILPSGFYTNITGTFADVQENNAVIYALNFDATINLRQMNFDNANITLSSGSNFSAPGHTFETGDRIFFTGILPSPLIVEKNYFIRVINANTVQIYANLSHAFFGNTESIISFGSTPSMANLNIYRGFYISNTPSGTISLLSPVSNMKLLKGNEGTSGGGGGGGGGEGGAGGGGGGSGGGNNDGIFPGECNARYVGADGAGGTEGGSGGAGGVSIFNFSFAGNGGSPGRGGRGGKGGKDLRGGDGGSGGAAGTDGSTGNRGGDGCYAGGFFTGEGVGGNGGAGGNTTSHAGGAGGFRGGNSWLIPPGIWPNSTSFYVGGGFGGGGGGGGGRGGSTSGSSGGIGTFGSNGNLPRKSIFSFIYSRTTNNITIRSKNTPIPMPILPINTGWQSTSNSTGAPGGQGGQGSTGNTSRIVFIKKQLAISPSIDKDIELMGMTGTGGTGLGGEAGSGGDGGKGDPNRGTAGGPGGGPGGPGSVGGNGSRGTGGSGGLILGLSPPTNIINY